MKVNVFEGYFDTNPKESSLEKIVHLIRNDALLRDRTAKHRYYKSQGLTVEAKTEKASCLNFAVAARFQGGKDIGHLHELTFMGLAEFDHLAPEEVQPLVETVRNDPHTLMDYISIGKEGVHVLFLYVVTNLTEADRNRYADIYGAAFDVANEYYSRLTGKKTDPNCRKCTQLSGLAHDPEVHYRPDAMPFEVVLPPVSSDRKPSHAPLLKAVRAAKAQLAEEGIVFKQGSRNEFLMRMGYLLNVYGVPMMMPRTGPSASMPRNMTAILPASFTLVISIPTSTVPGNCPAPRPELRKGKAGMRPWRTSKSSSTRRCRCDTM